MTLPSISTHDFLEYIALNLRYHHAEKLFFKEEMRWRDLCFQCNNISPCQYVDNEFKTPQDCITFNINNFYCHDGMQQALSERKQCKDKANGVFEKFKYDPQKEHPHYMECEHWMYYDNFVKQFNHKSPTHMDVQSI